MLVRSHINEARRARQRANQQRYRLRRVYGQRVLRITVNEMKVIDLLVAKNYLPENAIHSRAMVERALTRFIDDLGRRIAR
jgi:hypothetical protein